MLLYVPDDLKTAELCSIAVFNDGRAIHSVPVNLITYELCLNAVKTNNMCVLELIPERYKTSELCLEAVRNYGLHLKNVPAELKTQELCSIAVKQNAISLYFVPIHLQTFELCLIAIKQNSNAFSVIYDNKMKAKVALEYLQQKTLNEPVLLCIADYL